MPYYNKMMMMMMMMTMMRDKNLPLNTFKQYLKLENASIQTVTHTPFVAGYNRLN